MLMPSVMRFVVRYKKRFVCQPFFLLMSIPCKKTSDTTKADPL